MFYQPWLRPSPNRPVRAARRRGPDQRKKIRACLHLENLEERCLLDGTDYRPITEIDNNLANPNWGTAYTDLLRIARRRLRRRDQRTVASSGPKRPNHQQHPQ
jgi:hypothetical protein